MTAPGWVNHWDTPQRSADGWTRARYRFGMATEPLLIKFDDPIPCTVRLPGVGGSIEGEVIATEIQTNGDPWVQVKIPVWQRWHTQVKVGKPAVHGIGPAWDEMCCPAHAVETDADKHDDIAETVRIARVEAVAAAHA